MGMKRARDPQSANDYLRPDSCKREPEGGLERLGEGSDSSQLAGSMPPWTVFGRVRPHAILSRLTKQLHSGEIILSGPQLELKTQREDINWPFS